jgi:hypothetical protein
MSDIAIDLKLWPRQMQAFNTPATELMFGGSSRGGKSFFVRAALISWCLAIDALQCVLIRKKYDDILKNHVEGPEGFRALLAPLVKEKLVKITQDGVYFPNGSIIAFQHCQDERQFDSGQGIEKHVLVFDEATQIGERLIRFFRGWCSMNEGMKARLPEQFKGKFPRIIYTCNPIGQSVGFFRREFVKAREAFSIEKVGAFLRQYIPSRVEDNLSEDPEALRGRMQEIGDAALAKALIEGDWDAPIGDFFPEWSETRHVVPNFTPPDHWYRYRSFDWGTAEPFAVYWVAVSDGESFTDSKGVTRWYPKGALIFYKEWYGCDPMRPADGIRMRNEDMAYGIKERSTALELNTPILTDSLPFQDRGGPTIASVFMACGSPLIKGDTSRIPGWSQLRGRLTGKLIDANDKQPTPMIYFCESCRYARDYIPSLERNPKDLEDAVDSGEATHSTDAIRLACQAHIITNVKELEEKRPEPKNHMTFDEAFERHISRKLSEETAY